MSHVVKVGMVVRDLDALAAAAPKLGFELGRDVKTHVYFAGSHSKCDHVLRPVEGRTKQTYEVGVIRLEDGTFDLRYDPWVSQDNRIEALLGEKLDKLRQRYTAEVTIKDFRRQGYRVIESVDANGRVVLEGVK